MNKKHKIWQSHIPGKALAASVVNVKQKDKNGKVRLSPDIGFAIRFWKRALKDAGTLQELKQRKYHQKKSDKRRQEIAAAKYFQQCEDKRNQ